MSKDKARENLELFSFELFDRYGIFNFFTSKNGGFSEGGYSSLNLADYVGDDRDLVLKNRALLAGALKIKSEDFVTLEQLHSNEVRRYNGDTLRCDGVISDDRKRVFVINSADCVPILLASKDREAIGAIHAGWRGTIEGILKNAIDTFSKTFNKSREDILVGLAPAICKECYEVDFELYERFRERFLNFKECFSTSSKSDSTLRYHIDLKKLNYNIALESKIEEKNIEMSHFCTKCNSDLFFSYRIEQRCGRFWSGIRAN